MKDMITMKELFAIILRKGRVVIVFALVVAVLLAGLQVFGLAKDMCNSNSEEIALSNQKAQEEYQYRIAAIEERIEKAMAGLKYYEEYLQESILMQLDSHNVATSTISFVVSDIDTTHEETSFGISISREDELMDDTTNGRNISRLSMETGDEFVASMIQNQYLILWETLDFGSILDEKIDNCYLREVITLEKIDGGVLVLKAVAQDVDTADKWTKETYAYLQDMQDAIVESSCDHSFTIIASSKEIRDDEELNMRQLTKLEEASLCNKEITEMTKQMAEISSPKLKVAITLTDIVKIGVKYLVVGAVVGAVLGILWILVSYLFRDRLESSNQVEAVLSIPFLGSVCKPGNYWSRIANRTLGERVWNDEKQAISYACECVKARIEVGKKIAVLTTLFDVQNDAQLRPFANNLAQMGYQIVVVDDATHNPEAVRAVAGCDQIILAEKQGITNLNEMRQIISLVGRLDKAVLGFILF